jgi:hypothetical protein
MPVRGVGVVSWPALQKEEGLIACECPNCAPSPRVIWPVLGAEWARDAAEAPPSPPGLSGFKPDDGERFPDDQVTEAVRLLSTSGHGDRSDAS